MANNSTTLFKSDSGAGNNSLSYVQDAFNDISLPATNNTGLTSSATTNPLGDFFADSDTPMYGFKTLFVKDLVLVEDRSLWISNKPTYRIIFNESAPFCSAYVCGAPSINVDEKLNVVINMTDVGDIAGVTAKARRCVFLVRPSVTTPTTVSIKVDGAGSNTWNSGGSQGTLLNFNNGPRAHTIPCETSNETNDLHDFRVISQTQGAVKLVGIQLYFENTGANIQVQPGTTYYNKTRVTTTTGATLSLPSFGSSLGGRNLIYKSTTGTYGISTAIQPMQQSIGVGSNASTSLTVTTGHGSSFPAGSIIAGFYGSTAYIGSVTSVSTDTLTVNPAIYPASGVSGLLYKLAFGGFTAPIGISNYQLAYCIGSTELQMASNYNQSYIDPYGRFSYNYDSGIPGPTMFYGCSNFPFTTGKYLQGLIGGSYIRVEGYFSAADIEVTGYTSTGVGTIGGTFYINGIPAWSTVGTGITGQTKFSVFSGAGPGWNSFSWQFGSSHTAIALSRINLYTVRQPYGNTYGQLAHFDNIQSFIPQDNRVIGATFMSWGNYRRIYAFELPIVTSDSSQVTNAFYALRQGIPMSAASDGFTLVFFGKNIALGGTFAAGTTVAIDGTGISSASIWGRSYTALTEGFHTLSVSMAAGNTTIISHVDISRTTSDLTNLQKYADQAVKILEKSPTSAPINIPGFGKNVQFADQAAGTFTASTTTPTDVTGLSLKFTSKGGPVFAMVTGAAGASLSSFLYAPAAGDRFGLVYVVRDSTTFFSDRFGSNQSTHQIAVPPTITAFDLPGPGTFTYKVQVACTNASDTVVAIGNRLIVFEPFS